MAPVSTKLLAAMFLVSGATHLAAPQVFSAIMPRLLPNRSHRPLVLVSGVAELACAVGLLRRRPWAGSASALLLVAVFPANVQMALDSGSGRNPGPADSRLVAWGRLPLQLPLLQAAVRARAPRR
jgi:uncharacterized membrane protein